MTPEEKEFFDPVEQQRCAVRLRCQLETLKVQISLLQAIQSDMSLPITTASHTRLVAELEAKLLGIEQRFAKIH